MNDAAPITNDNAELTPRTSFDGPALTFDFPGLRVGVAEYDEGPTGCTVLLFDRTHMSAVDVRGGSPGTYMADAGVCGAVCFAGGSLLGLEASAGVAAELFAMNGHRPGWENIPVVQGAIVFDMQGPNSVYPDKELGRAAVRAAREGHFPLGPRGAGRNVAVGKGIDVRSSEPAGQGAAFGQWGEAKVAVFTVVNAVGAIVGRDGRVVRGQLQADGTRLRFEDDIRARLAGGKGVTAASPGNTTLTAVVTNQRMGQPDLAQLSRQVHTSMARAIQHFHTMFDGDMLIAVTTSDVDASLPAITLGALASELAWDAVLASFEPDPA